MLYTLLHLICSACIGIPAFTFVDKFYATLAFMGVAVAVVALAVGVRLLRELRAVARRPISVMRAEIDLAQIDVTLRSTGISVDLGCVQKLEATPLQDARGRMKHSLIVLLSVFYLRLTLLQLTALQCTVSPDPNQVNHSDTRISYGLYLLQDLSTTCWSARHIPVVFLSLLLLLVYSFGFPIACFVALTREFADDATGGLIGMLRRRISFLRPQEKRTVRNLAVIEEMATADRRLAGYAFMYNLYRPFHFAYGLSLFLDSAAVATVSVFVYDPSTSLFLLGIICAGRTMSGILELPYIEKSENMRSALVGLAVVVRHGEGEGR
jgi:hypothetical protein